MSNNNATIVNPNGPTIVGDAIGYSIPIAVVAVFGGINAAKTMIAAEVGGVAGATIGSWIAPKITGNSDDGLLGYFIGGAIGVISALKMYKSVQQKPVRRGKRR